MKRGPLILTLVAGTLVFLCVLVLYLPASWFVSWLPAQVRCADLGGSVWHGECLGLTVQDARLGDATWNLSPLKAITGRLSGDVDVRGGSLTARSDIDLKLDGSGDLRNLSAQFPLDPAFVARFSPNYRGLVAARFAHLQLAALSEAHAATPSPYGAARRARCASESPSPRPRARPVRVVRAEGRPRHAEADARAAA